MKTNLYLFPNSRPDNILDTHKIITNRLLALELHYGRQDLLSLFKNKLDNRKYLWIEISRHMSNLVTTYGEFDVKHLVIELYPELKQKTKKVD